MSTDEVCMIVGEDNKLECGSSFGDEVFVDSIVIGWINNVGLAVGFDIVGKDGKHFSFELNDIDSILVEF